MRDAHAGALMREAQGGDAHAGARMRSYAGRLLLSSGNDQKGARMWQKVHPPSEAGVRTIPWTSLSG